MEIIDGYKGVAHVKASQVGLHQQGLIGPDSYILNNGNNLSYQIISGNKIRILDGIIVVQGRRGCIEPGFYEELVIENGSQGEYRKDIIAIQYSKTSDTGIESFDLVVVKGTPATDTPALPELTSADINSGGMLHQEALYVVTISDAAITSVEGQLETLCSVADMVDLDGSYDGKKAGWLKKLGGRVFAHAHARTVLWSGTTTLYSKLTEVINSISAHKSSGDHDSRYYTEVEVDGKISGHNHDGRYYTETEMDSKLNGKAAANHNHDSLYYKKADVDKKFIPAKVNFTTNPASFVATSNASYSCANIATINMYIKSGSNVMANNNDLLVGVLSVAPINETLISMHDDAEKALMLGRIKTDGSIIVKARNLEGERYLTINASFAFSS